jgi:hypothetical protein
MSWEIGVLALIVGTSLLATFATLFACTKLWATPRIHVRERSALDRQKQDAVAEAVSLLALNAKRARR